MSRPLRMLVVANVGLAGTLGLAWLAAPAAWTPPAPLPPEPESLAAVAIAPTPAPDGARLAMIERPVFVPGRRPSTDDAGPDAAGVAAPGSASDLALLGIVRGRTGASAIARADGEIRRLSPGGRIGPWTLEALGDNSARFTGDGGEVRELALRHAPGGAAAPQASPDTAAAAPPAPTPPQADAGGEDQAVEDPITHKSFEQRVAERRAYREALQRRLGETP